MIAPKIHPQNEQIMQIRRYGRALISPLVAASVTTSASPYPMLGIATALPSRKCRSERSPAAITSPDRNQPAFTFKRLDLTAF